MRGTLHHQTKEKRVVLIIPTKGISDTYQRFLDSMLGQDYKNYRIIFVTQSTDDPAYSAIQDRLKTQNSHPEVNLIVAGLSENTGQKVHNQRAALATLRDDDELIAFADSDLFTTKDWLSCMVLPLNKDTSDFTTGYRWFLPANLSLANRLVGIIGITLETWINPGWRMCLWGGSMAMQRNVYEELDIYEKLDRSFNDDVHITEIARNAGKRMRHVRSVDGISPVDFGFASLFEFGRRQYFQIKLHHSGLALAGILCHTLYLISFSACMVSLFMGNFFMLIPLAIGISLNLLRTHHRQIYLSERFSGEEKRILTSLNKGSWYIDPLEKIVHLAITLSAFFGNEIVWGGIRYRLKSSHSVEIIERDI